MRMIVIVIIAAVPSQSIISQDINQHSLDSMVCRLTASDITDLQGITVIKLDVQKVKTAAKEPQVDTIKPYLPAQLGPKS